MAISHLTRGHGIFAMLAFSSLRVFRRRSRSSRSRKRLAEWQETWHETDSLAAGLPSRQRSCERMKTQIRRPP